MHAPFFWLFLVVFVMYFFLRGWMQTRAKQRAAIAQEQQAAARREEAERIAAERRERAAHTRTKQRAPRDGTPPRFPSEAEQNATRGDLCEPCRDPAHLDCSGDADCSCCRHTLNLIASSQESGA